MTELRRLEAVRRDFVSNVSHELKTPVAAISALAETLVDNPPGDPARVSAFAGRIGEQAERLHRLVVDVIRLARVESGRDVFDVRRVAVGPVAERCVAEHRPAAEVCGVSLHLHAPPSPVHVTADPDALGDRAGQPAGQRAGPHPPRRAGDGLLDAPRPTGTGGTGSCGSR